MVMLSSNNQQIAAATNKRKLLYKSQTANKSFSSSFNRFRTLVHERAGNNQPRWWTV